MKRLKEWIAKNGRLCALVAPLQFLLFSPAALAQRGSAYTKTDDIRAQSPWPSKGISGFFDAEVPSEGTLLFDFPTFSLDYGLTDRWSIGTNALMGVLTLSELTSRSTPKNFLLLLKTRYKVFASQGWEGSVSGYAGSSRIHTFSTQSAADEVSPQLDTNTQKSTFFLSTLNISKEIANNKFGLSMAVLQTDSDAGVSGMVGHSTERLSSILLSPWYRYRISESLEMEGLALLCPLSKGVENNPMFRIESNRSCLSISGSSALLRMLVNWRSSESWLWTAGIVPASFVKPFFLPILGFTYIGAQEKDATPTSAEQGRDERQ
jgi:hypothetical protein